MVQIDLRKADTAVEDPFLVEGCVLRTRIRELVTAFLVKPRPIGPTDADILNDYLVDRRPDFRQAVDELSDLTSERLSSTPRNRHRFDHLINGATARRAEIVASVALSDDFLTFRSEAKVRYHEALSAYEEEESVIAELRSFLGAPYLPDIEAEVLSAPEILKALTKPSSKWPRKGQIVLMADDDLYKRPQFAARSLLARGLEARLLRGQSIVAIPFANSTSQVVEACSVGAFERGRRTIFTVRDGRPLASVPWHQLDSFLPFACRSVSVPILPLASPAVSGFSFEEVFGRDIWRQIETEAVDESAGVCMMCGSSDKVSAHAAWRFREPVEGTYAPGLAELTRMMVYCRSCSDALRPSVRSLFSKSSDGYILNRNKAREDWLAVINRWTGQDCDGYVVDAYVTALASYRRRSRHNWIIDLKGLRSIFFQLEPGFHFDSENWIHGPSGQIFKIVQLPVYDENKIRHFAPAPDVFEVPFGSTLSQVTQLLADHDFAAIDKRGAGHTDEILHELDGKLSEDLERSMDACDDATGDEPIAVDVSKRINACESGASEDAGEEDDDDDDEAYEDQVPDYQTAWFKDCRSGAKAKAAKVETDAVDEVSDSSGDDETGFDQP